MADHATAISLKSLSAFLLYVSCGNWRQSRTFLLLGHEYVGQGKGLDENDTRACRWIKIIHQRLATRSCGREGKNGQILILFVQRDAPPTRYATNTMVARWQEQERKKALSNSRVRRLITKTNARVHVVAGEPAASILNFAPDNAVNEVIMGTRGLGALKGLLIGSVTSKVYQLATVPVTLVK